jgi:hypothetical protein
METKLEMLKALQGLKRELPVLPKDRTNPHFKSKYTSLDAIGELIDPVVDAHGFLWLTKPGIHEKGPTLEYELVHVGTGESISGVMPLMLQKADPQGQGSAITYARRYSLCAVLNLVADEDDDGNSAVAAARAMRAVNAEAGRISRLPEPPADNPPTELPSAAESNPEIVKLAGRIKTSGIEPSAVKLKLLALGVEDPKDLESALTKLSAEQRTDLINWVEGEKES